MVSRIRQLWRGKIEENCLLAPFTSFKVGGPAEAVVFPESIEELSGLIRTLAAAEVPWFVLGKGSNLLIPDKGVSGAVIVLSRLRNCTISTTKDEKEEKRNQKVVELEIEAGSSLAHLVRFCTEHQLTGLEFLSGVPGSVGGAIAMNAGAFGSETCHYVRQVQLLDHDGSTHKVDMAQKDICYRKWVGRGERIIVAARFLLQIGSTEMIHKRCMENAAWRKKTQPQLPSAGSFFKNPPGDFAGRLIEKAGLKGVRIGGAEVSTKHANFIVNLGWSTAKDIRDLAILIQEKVFNTTGVKLEPEVEMIGG